ncbi:MAG: TIGR03790 family protein [Pseudomonadota bacterium]
MRAKKGPFFILSVVTFFLLFPGISWALLPEQVVVVANKMAWHSEELAKYYMLKRNIPEGNLILLRAPSGEDCTREEYNEKIASPVRAFLEKNDPEGKKFQCLALMFGLPLRINPTELTPGEAKGLSELKKQHAAILQQIKEVEPLKDQEILKILKESEKRLKRQIDLSDKVLQGASVDSEIALVREGSYPLNGWLPNKFFLWNQKTPPKNLFQKVLMVSRLDGPTERIVRRIIDDSIETEKEGLKGIAYFDARWADPGNKELSGYPFYDRAIHQAAGQVGKSERMPVVLDSKERLFQPGECLKAALYCGWYSLGQYVDAFTWVKGAVGYHIASAECTTLKGKSSRVWCKMMLEKGVAATLGPVAEPYVEAFPPPDLFFGLLLDGRFTLAECYVLSNPFLSWQMVLIGDPLYRPFLMKPFPFLRRQTQSTEN